MFSQVRDGLHLVKLTDLCVLLVWCDQWFFYRMVVELASAGQGISEADKVHIQANHINICKPPSREHRAYSKLKEFLEAHMVTSEQVGN